MNNNFPEAIVEKFSERFASAYKNLEGAGKTKVIKYIPIIFKRWYFSALINETTLSPSFIYSASLIDSNMGDSATTHALSIMPVLAGNKIKYYNIKENRYSIKSHPVVSDLRALVDFCAPDVELNGDSIAERASDGISKLLSLSDPFYVDYLTAVAFHLNLIKRLPAIYSDKACISPHYKPFLELNQEEALKKVVDATVKICSNHINAALPYEIPLFSKKGILDIIKKPITIDELFKRAFSAFGINIENVWTDFYSNKNAESQRNELINSTFFIGILLDKWFVTPFSQYLKIIEPIYSYSYNFEDELSFLHNVIKANGDINAAVFSPCAFYSFTNFGRVFFASGNADSSRNPVRMPESELLSVLGYNNVPYTQNEFLNMETKRVYCFKVKFYEDKRYWKRIDIADYNTLHELHLEIAIGFDFSISDYTIYTDENQSPFSKYSCEKSRGKHYKSDRVKVSQLGLTAGKKMIYISDSGRKLEIDLLKTETRKSRDIYPRTVKVSKKMREYYGY